MGERGPESAYAEWMCDLIQDVAAVPGQYQAAMRWELGKSLGKKGPISTATFKKWREEHPEFEEAWQNSITISQATDEKLAHDVATGKIKGNPTALALLFNAKYRDEYKPTETNTTTINQTVNYIENLSTDELKYKIARAQEVIDKAGFLIEAKPIVRKEDADKE